MDKRELLDHLEQLHDELSKAEHINDEETLRLLRALTSDLDKLHLGDSEPKQDEVRSTATRLRDVILKFETEHPQVAGLIEKISTGLANIGI